MKRREFLGLTTRGLAGCLIGRAALAADSPEKPVPVPLTNKGKKFVVGHRGACAYAPENTLPSYRLALEQKADYVEQDLQITKDRVLVCSHDETLERMTNVAEVFPDRFTEATVKGRKVKRWPIHNFTLKEIKQLDAGAKFHPKFKGTAIPSWQEAIDEIKGKAGLCPELKSPELYQDLGIGMEQLVAEMLKKNGLDNPRTSTPILIQSFSKACLEIFAQKKMKHPMLRLFNAGMKWTSADLDEVRSYAAAIGPSKGDITDEFVRETHSRGLQIVAYTYNSKNLLPQFPDIRAEITHALYELGIDGLFTDNPDLFARR